VSQGSSGMQHRDKECSDIQKWHMLQASRSSKTVHATGATDRHTNRGVNRCLIAFQASIYFNVIQYALMIL